MLLSKFARRTSYGSFEEVTERKRVAESYRFRNLGDGQMLLVEQLCCLGEMLLLDVFRKGDPHVFAKYLGRVFFRVSQDGG